MRWTLSYLLQLIPTFWHKCRVLLAFVANLIEASFFTLLMFKSHKFWNTYPNYMRLRHWLQLKRVWSNRRVYLFKQEKYSSVKGVILQVCVYIHTYIHTYVHTHIHTYINIVRTYIYTYVRVYIHTYIHTCIHTYVLTYIHTWIYIVRTYIYTYVRVYIHTYIHTCILTYIHTYMHIYFLPPFFVTTRKSMEWSSYWEANSR